MSECVEVELVDQSLHQQSSRVIYSNRLEPVVSGTYVGILTHCRSMKTHKRQQDGSMRCFKARTLVTVSVSALVGATLYFILYGKLSPASSNSWAFEERAGETSNNRARGVGLHDKSLSRWNTADLKKFKAKMDEINKNVRNESDYLSHQYSSCGSTNSTTQQNCSKTAHEFPISWPFHFPQPRYSLSTRQLLQSHWVSDLQAFLRTVDGKQVSVVTSSIEHTDILFNWLISAYLVAQPPLKNILVLTLDKSLHDLAEQHGFASLYVSPKMVIDPKAAISRVFSQVHIVRLAVVRLMNHYGYDVVNYDCDAILLKNPQTIFDSHMEADMIGTFGKGPNHLYTKWGVTLNTGVMLLRANAKLEAYWEAMNGVKDPTTDDQGSINKALDTLKVKWMNLKPTDNIDVIERDVFGVVSIKSPQAMKMIVMLMPFSTVCRQTCMPEKRNEYFVWHAVAIKENRTVERKMSQARVGNAWFLSEQWQAISDANPFLKGVEWLRKVVDPNLIKLIKNKSDAKQ